MPEATNDVVWAWIGTGSPWTLLWLWLALINLMTFLVFGFDKLKAKYKEKHEGARRRRCFCWRRWAAVWVRCWECGSGATRRFTGVSALESR